MLKRFLVILVILCLLLSVSGMSFGAAPANFKVIGYVFSDADTNAVQYSKMTHICYAFARPTATGGFNIDNPSNFSSLVTKAHQNGKKVFLSIGGGQQASTDNFATFAANSSYRTAFVNNCINAINQYGIDGIDVDWEFPAGGNNPSNYASLISELGTAIHNKGKLLTAAVNAYGANADCIQSATFNSFDWLNIMAYDKGIGAANSPYQVAVDSIDYWVGRGLPASKVILGLPFYSSPGSIAYKDLVANDSQAPNKDSSTYNGVVEYYNGINTIKSKTNLALNKEAGGVMVWESMQDTTSASTSLFSAINAAMATYNGGGTSTTYSATADSYVRGGTYAAQNFGTATTMDIKDAAGDYLRSGYIKFTATGLSNITSAKLRLYGKADSNATVNIYSVGDDSWTETGINFNNKPALASLLATKTLTTTAQYYEFDVTSFVKSEVSAGYSIFTFGITGPNTTQNINISFNSKENTANKPQLIITK